MSDAFYDFGKDLLFALPTEQAHNLAIRALSSGYGPRPDIPYDSRLSSTVAGLKFSNPLGMAAGFDKNARAVPGLFRLGFGAVEIGSVTPKAQEGNPAPRLYRLPGHRAIINRMGFNNEGHAEVLSRLRGKSPKGILGVNIGANKDSEDRIGDYVTGIKVFNEVADYFTANISSPNTPGLRSLQTRQSLKELFERILEERDRQPVRRPVFLKIAPDLAEDEIDAIAEESVAREIDGIVISNTTLSRREVEGARNAGQAGGLSGRPVFLRSTIVLAKMRARVGPDMPLIGVGGIESAETAAEKMRAGADLIQIYTGFIYGGPMLPVRILDGLKEICEREGLESLSAIRDTKTAGYAARPLE
ncbi:MAG: dihydroorotate dehydrogenase (quinone) [Rhizobiales bacterium]|nr:dihydroorotate dehydrogenase (quinone) [Hyphomicrobiales bacterium]MBA67508.1 dihydroorotate dehydrogenase (quinone) [Hyphomicrobiales bacterium]